jgi:hypothetical protein
MNFEASQCDVSCLATNWALPEPDIAVDELEVDGVEAEEPEAPEPVTPGLAEPGVVVVAGAGVGEPAGELVVCANAGESMRALTAVTVRSFVSMDRSVFRGPGRVKISPQNNAG